MLDVASRAVHEIVAETRVVEVRVVDAALEDHVIRAGIDLRIAMRVGFASTCDEELHDICIEHRVVAGAVHPAGREVLLTLGGR